MKKIVLLTVLLISFSAAVFAVGSDFISREKAMEIAASDARINLAEARFVHSHLDRDDGRMVYDVEFYVNGTEYDYEIDAVTGRILSVDRDAEYWGSGSGAPSPITAEEAARIALEDAGVSEMQSIRTNLDRDDGRLQYEVRFRTDDNAYEYIIDGMTGRILGTDMERLRPAGASSILSKDEALSLVLERIPGAEARNVRLHQSRDDGRIVYEGEARFSGYEYEFEIDAATGRFTDWERDRDDWF